MSLSIVLDLVNAIISLTPQASGIVVAAGLAICNDHHDIELPH